MDNEALPHCLRRRPHRLREHMPAVRRRATARRERFGPRPERPIRCLLQPDQVGEWDVTVAIDRAVVSAVVHDGLLRRAGLLGR